MGGGKYFPSVYVSVRALRFVGCELPIRVYYFGASNEMPEEWKEILRQYKVTFRDLDDSGTGFAFPAGAEPSNMTERAWAAKIRAVLDSPFEDVLFLDADCYPCRNPEILFEHPEYRETGAIFWHNRKGEVRPWWDAFRTKPKSERFIEAGQFVVNKRHCWQLLQLGWWYARHHSATFRWGYGDMHACFDVPWAKLNRAYTSFAPEGVWISIAYQHVGPDGNPMFIHRIRDKFRLPGASDWMTPQTFNSNTYTPDFPLEAEAFRWMAELAIALGLHAGVLNLACGRSPLLGAKNHDLTKHSDFVDDAHDLNQRPWPWPDSSIDTLIADRTLGYLGDVPGFMQEAHRIIKPGGRLVLRVAHWLSEGTWRDPRLLWSFKEDAITTFLAPQPPSGRINWKLAASREDAAPTGRWLKWELEKLGPNVFAESTEFCAAYDFPAERSSIEEHIATAGSGRITMATLYTPEFRELGELTAGAMQRYSKRHGYRSVVATEKLDPERPATWSKLLLVEHVMQNHSDCEWVMWLDSDAVITDPSHRLEGFLDPELDFIIGDDPACAVNAGVFLARNCDAVRDLLCRTYEKVQYLYHRIFEQRALEEALEESDARLRWKIIPRRRFNSFSGEYQPGDFVIHFAACPPEVKIQGAKNVLRSIAASFS